MIRVRSMKCEFRNLDSISGFRVSQWRRLGSVHMGRETRPGIQEG